MQLLHKIIDCIFEANPSFKEFCFLALPLAKTANVKSDLYNATLWNNYFDAHPNAIDKLKTILDGRSIRWIKRLIKRRKTNRYFLTFSEIYRYYKAKHLVLHHWFPRNGTLLKSVFVCKAGLCYIPPHHLSALKNRIAVDGGAASGDSSVVLHEAGARKVLAFEPSPRQRDEIQKVISRNKLSEKIEVVPYALGETRDQITFNDQYAYTFTAETISIDEYCRGMDIGCIKLDIEGAEYPTLLGAAHTISRCHPILLVCAYHRPEDLFEMPLWLHEKFPFYNIKIHETEPGNYGVGAHLMLIAWPTDQR